MNSFFIRRFFTVLQFTLNLLSKSAGVLALETFDITADGVPDVLVGRDDGLIEVYGFDEMDEPVHRFKQVTRLCKIFLFRIKYTKLVFMHLNSFSVSYMSNTPKLSRFV